MFFVYDSPQPVAFWMGNTLIPLDMLFFDASGRLERVKDNATPHDQTPIVGGEDIRTSSRSTAAFAGPRHRPGRCLHHLGLDQAIAAWPCD